MFWRILLLVFANISSVFASQTSCLSTQPYVKPEIVSKMDVGSIALLGDKQVFKNKQHILTGNAGLYQKQSQLNAQTIIINNASHTFFAKDSVRINSDNMQFSSQQAVGKNLNTTPTYYLKKSSFNSLGSQFYGQADASTSTQNQHIFAKNTFTNCPPEQPVWLIQSQSMQLDFDKNRGYAEHAIFKLDGLPILYLPKYSWVLSGRGSGFLFPEFSTINNGDDYHTVIPYYFNLSPSQAMTISLNRISDRGNGVKIDYAQLFAHSDFDLQANYFNKDQLTKKSRWRVHSNNKFHLSPKLNLTLDYNRVSDVDFFSDIEKKSFTDTSLKSLIKLDYSAKQTQVSLSHDEQQLINGSLGYLRQPELIVNHQQDQDDGVFDSQFQSTQFNHNTPTKTQGIRNHLALGYAYTFEQPAYSLTPGVNVYHTKYHLDKQDNAQQSIVNLNLDAKLNLLRELDWFSSSIVQTLTPRIFYNYTQNKDQTRLPNFDTEAKSLSYTSLFSSRHSTGSDRFTGAKNITLGLASSLQNQQGKTFVEAKIARSFYADNTFNPFDKTRDKSNVLADFFISQKKWSYNLDLQYDNQDKILIEKHHTLAYKKNRRQFLSAAFHSIDKQDDESGQLYGQFPLNKNLDIFAGAQYDFDQGIVNKNTRGFVYKNCCLSLSIQRLTEFNTTLNNRETTTKIKFNLLGFSGDKFDLTTQTDFFSPD